MGTRIRTTLGIKTLTGMTRMKIIRTRINIRMRITTTRMRTKITIRTKMKNTISTKGEMMRTRMQE